MSDQITLLSDEISANALTNIVIETDPSPVVMSAGEVRDVLKGQFEITITPNESYSAYIVGIRTRLITTTRFNWSGGDGTLHVTITWTGTDGSTKTYSGSINTNTPINGTGTSSNPYYSPWNGPLTFTDITALGAKNLTFDIDLDFLRTTCSVPGCDSYHQGPGSNSRHDEDGNPGPNAHYQHIYTTQSINVEEIPLVQPPVISNLVNTNPYNNNASISASESAISLSWTHSGGSPITASYYSLNNGSWLPILGTSLTSYVIYGLSPGTTYPIAVRSYNDGGYSNQLSISVRTKHRAPVVSLSYASRTLESITFNWSSDKPLASSQYKIGNGSWLNAGVTGTSGSFTVSGLTPNTTYTIYFRGVSTSTYDSLNSNETSASGTTLDIARITNIGDCIFGTNIPIQITHPSSNTAKLKIWTTGNSRQPEFEYTVTAGTFTFAPTQEQLDQMYKCFTTANTIPINFQLTTIGTQNWVDAQQSKSLQLTGIAKTAHIGVDNNPRRAQAWIGIDDVPRRAIVWVGDSNNKPRRCI